MYQVTCSDHWIDRDGTGHERREDAEEMTKQEARVLRDEMLHCGLFAELVDENGVGEWTGKKF